MRTITCLFAVCCAAGWSFGFGTCRSAVFPSAAAADETPSGDGIIAFESRRRGMDLFLVKPDGSECRWFTGGGAPSFSADGKKIVYAAYFNDTGSTELFLINADGTDDRRHTQTEIMEQSPAVSPDGSIIAFTEPETRDGALTSAVFVMRADGSERRRLTDGDTPAFSSDGTRLAFSAILPAGGTDSDIYMIGLDGTGLALVTSNDREDREPCWSPDGARIAFTTHGGAGKNWDIAVIGADGSGETVITGGAGNNMHPAWSPDGERIAFSSDRDPTGDLEIFVMNADGGNTVNITNHPAQDCLPSWGR